MCNLFVLSQDFAFILKTHKVYNSFRTLQLVLKTSMLTTTNICSLYSVLTRNTLYATVAVTLDIFFFCIRSFALQRKQPENDMQNVDLPPLEKFLQAPMPCH